MSRSIVGRTPNDEARPLQMLKMVGDGLARQRTIMTFGNGTFRRKQTNFVQLLRRTQRMQQMQTGLGRQKNELFRQAPIRSCGRLLQKHETARFERPKKRIPRNSAVETAFHQSNPSANMVTSAEPRLPKYEYSTLESCIGILTRNPGNTNT